MDVFFSRRIQFNYYYERRQVYKNVKSIKCSLCLIYTGDFIECAFESAQMCFKFTIILKWQRQNRMQSIVVLHAQRVDACEHWIEPEEISLDWSCSKTWKQRRQINVLEWFKTGFVDDWRRVCYASCMQSNNALVHSLSQFRILIQAWLRAIR